MTPRFAQMSSFYLNHAVCWFRIVSLAMQPQTANIARMARSAGPSRVLAILVRATLSYYESAYQAATEHVPKSPRTGI